jgi:sugar phosphate isomerase/epimerase
MKITRKKFMQNSSIAIAGALFFSEKRFLSPLDPNSITGLQLYSVRDDMKNDPLGTLKKLSILGYKNVEHANYADGKFYGYSPKEFKKILSDLGLKMPSGHTVLSDKQWNASSSDFSDLWKKTVEDAAFMGQKYVISPWLDESLRKDYDSLVQFLEIMNHSGELCKKEGMKFGYHNHDFEFKSSLNGKLIYDIILEKTDPALVIQQLDFGNMYGAGVRALNLLKKYPGRFEAVHIKDEIKSSGKGEMGDGYESTVLGTGLIPIKEVLEEFQKSGGTRLFIIEQESYQNKTPLEAAGADLMAMKSWGY